MSNSTTLDHGLLGDCLPRDRGQPTDPVSVCFATVYILFGIVYTLFGYRCFKAVMFLTGFIFASVIVYLICIQEKLLPSYANAGIGFCAGILFGLITMLVQYVGLFVTGFHTGLFVAVAALALIDQFVQPQTLLVTVGSLLGSGLLFAILNLQCQKGLTIFGTSLYGGALISGSVDYLLEGLRSAKWFWRHWGRSAVAATAVSSSSSSSLVGGGAATGSGSGGAGPPVAHPPLLPCYPVIALWPTILVVGLAVQIFFTAPPTHNACKHGVRARTREQRAELRQNKYRYLYQVRTAHGDVISQNYVQALQNKVVGPGETSTLESDATHLTMLPDGQPDLNRTSAVSFYR